MEEAEELGVGFISAPLGSSGTRFDDRVNSLIASVKHQQFKGIDILLANEWPKEILTHIEYLFFTFALILLPEISIV